MDDNIASLIGLLPTLVLFLINCLLGYATTTFKLKLETRRENELRDQTKGSPVWFSLHRELGLCRHMVLYVGGSKYELTLPRGSQEQAESKVTPSGLPTHPGRPPTGEFVAFHIGWTERESAEIERRARAICYGWRYDRFRQNCQHFVNLLWSEVMCEKFDEGWEKMEAELGLQDRSRIRIMTFAALGHLDG